MRVNNTRDIAAIYSTDPKMRQSQPYLIFLIIHQTAKDYRDKAAKALPNRVILHGHVMPTRAISI